MDVHTDERLLRDVEGYEYATNQARESFHSMSARLFNAVH
jgi:hypothetical protein